MRGFKFLFFKYLSLVCDEIRQAELGILELVSKMKNIFTVRILSNATVYKNMPSPSLNRCQNNKIYKYRLGQVVKLSTMGLIIRDMGREE